MYYIYITTNKKNGVLYIGMTHDLLKRSFKHKSKFYKNSFTTKYNLDKLVYFESYFTKEEAFIRERMMKKWNRLWKVKLIERDNPGWEDLYYRFGL